MVSSVPVKLFDSYSLQILTRYVSA